ncbi:MAG: amidohydrolase, partial [Crenarchaeota archaeon]|nr:amidohydrolase [Thermoproteota archaeon]
DRGLPVTVETCNSGWGLGFQDDPGMPRLRRLLQTVSNTVIIGHGPAFWAEIGPVKSAEEKGSYPKGRIVEEGALPDLFRCFPNLYADISAASGFNALSRDLEYSVRFLNEFQDRLMFGTDIISRDLAQTEKEQQNIREMLEVLFKKGYVTPEAWSKIRWGECLMPQLDYLKKLVEEGFISRKVFRKITWDNAAKLLKL